VSTLYDDEVEKLAGFAKTDPNTVADVIGEAVAAGLILLLPPAPDRSDFPGWNAFTIPGGSRTAHLCEEGSWLAFCGAGRPVGAVVPEPRSRVCTGCAHHAEVLRKNPKAIDLYSRGRGPRELVASPVPIAFAKAKPAAPPEQAAPPKRSPLSAVSRPAPPRPVETPVVRPEPQPEPEAPEAPTPPSLFDAPSEREPRRRPQANTRTF
jgi:hypothetical protein